MRADRLLTLLLLLQTRGRMSARELAEELEVSERTIYRDIEALSLAGVPVYAETGRDGGYALLESYRTSLTGLTEAEVQALFMLEIPAPLADLGVGQALRSALLKFAAALPEEHRFEESRVRQRFYLDASWWERGGESPPHLQALYQAVWQDRKVLLTYRPLANVVMEQTVDPYGLVAKAGVWYLVCARAGRIRVHRISELIATSLLDEGFARPEGFDLAGFWAGWVAERARQQGQYPVVFRISPQLRPYLQMYFGERVQSALDRAGEADERGWLTLELSFESLEAARDCLLACGGGVEVLAPRALRLGVRDYAEQIAAVYGSL